MLNSTSRRIGNRFETGLFWRRDVLELPESKNIAMKRISMLEKKMDKDPIYAQVYMEKRKNIHISKGYIK